MLRFSLIVCTRDRAALLERLLYGVAMLRYSEFELIIICDPGDPVTARCLERHAPAAKIGHCADANLAKARNIGLALAQGEIAAFIDDDAIPEADWLNRLAACYAEPGVAAAGGFIRARDTASFQNRFVLIDPFGKDHAASELPSALPTGWFLSLTGANFSIRRAAALALGGFDENYPYFLEETDLLLRLNQTGGRIIADPGAQVRHYPAASAVRTKHGAPKSLRGIARSKAYFCHINRRAEISLPAIHQALSKFQAAKYWLIWSNFFLARLSLRTAFRLSRELQEGIREGEKLAEAGRSMADFVPVAGSAFKALQARQPPCRHATQAAESRASMAFSVPDHLLG
jgi:glycogen(starch) synthase